MAVTQITTHEADAKARLPEQFKDKTVINAVVGAIGLEMQDLEDAIFPMFDLLDISTMIGAQLDGIGDILTEPRDGKSDANYRLALDAKAARITASGTPEQLIERMIQLASATGVLYEGVYPGKVRLTPTTGELPVNLFNALEAAAPTGVKVIVAETLELTGSTYDGETFILTGSTYDGEDMEVNFSL